jgi:hypothetical protein
MKGTGFLSSRSTSVIVVMIRLFSTEMCRVQHDVIVVIDKLWSTQVQFPSYKITFKSIKWLLLLLSLFKPSFTARIKIPTDASKQSKNDSKMFVSSGNKDCK